ncbi:glucose dehydrogenase [Plakobranchus ocellatus]|uniref:Glucose dehydrogenase n=1 Tax=Plakobranchus ocellatus TaxID=259542 RepID=A0AAV3ZS12_9GAST|nr:glucose dehydrogenase [Plakobranchus ocellatus]
MLQPPTGGRGFLLMPTALQLKSRGRVRLMSRDYQASPIIDPGFLTEDSDVEFLFSSSPQQCDLRPSGHPSGQGAGGGARTRDRMTPADIRADSLVTVPPTPLSAIRLTQTVITTEPMRKIGAQLDDRKRPGCEDFDYDSDDYWRCYVCHFAPTAHHGSGTCNMRSADDNTAVVVRRLSCCLVGHGCRNSQVTCLCRIRTYTTWRHTGWEEDNSSQ